MAAKLFSQGYAKGYDLSNLTFTLPAHKTIANYIVEQEKAGERIRPSALFEILEEDCEELNEILNLNYEDKLSGEVASRFFADSVRALEREAIEKEIERYSKEYEQETDTAQKQAKARKIAEYIKKRNQLKK